MWNKNATRTRWISVKAALPRKIAQCVGRGWVWAWPQTAVRERGPWQTVQDGSEVPGETTRTTPTWLHKHTRSLRFSRAAKEDAHHTIIRPPYDKQDVESTCQCNTKLCATLWWWSQNASFFSKRGKRGIVVNFAAFGAEIVAKICIKTCNYPFLHYFDQRHHSLWHSYVLLLEIKSGKLLNCTKARKLQTLLILCFLFCWTTQKQPLELLILVDRTTRKSGTAERNRQHQKIKADVESMTLTKKGAENHAFQAPTLLVTPC